MGNRQQYDGALFARHDSRAINPAAEFERLRADAPRPTLHPVDDVGAAFALQLAADVVDELDRWESSDARSRATPETVRTAATLRQQADWLRLHAEKHGKPQPSGLTLKLTHERIAHLRDLRAVFLVRAAGAENAVGEKQAREKKLPRRPKVEIDEAQLRAEWERQKRLRPHADKKTLLQIVAEKLNTSDRTIRRRLKQYGIDPPRNPAS